MTGSRHPLKKDEQAIVDLLADGTPRTTADIVRVLADGDFVSQRTAARDVARIVPHLCYWGYVRRLIYSGGIRDRLVGAQTVGPVCQTCWWGEDPALDPDFHVATCSLCGAVTHDGIYAPVSGIKVVASAEGVECGDMLAEEQRFQAALVRAVEECDAVEIPDPRTNRYSRWFTEWPSTHERAGQTVEVIAVEMIRDLLPKVYDGMHLTDCPYVDVLQRIAKAVR